MIFLAIFLFFLSFLGVFAGEAHPHSFMPTRHQQHHGRLVSRNCNNFSKTYTMTDFYHGKNFLTYVGLTRTPLLHHAHSLALANGISLPQMTLHTGTFDTRARRMLYPKDWPSSRTMEQLYLLLMTRLLCRLEESGIRQSSILSASNLRLLIQTIQRSYQYEKEVQRWIVHCRYSGNATWL
jgi:hypothetical protein